MSCAGARDATDRPSSPRRPEKPSPRPPSGCVPSQGTCRLRSPGAPSRRAQGTPGGGPRRDPAAAARGDRTPSPAAARSPLGEFRAGRPAGPLGKVTDAAEHLGRSSRPGATGPGCRGRTAQPGRAASRPVGGAQLGQGASRGPPGRRPRDAPSSSSWRAGRPASSRSRSASASSASSRAICRPIAARTAGSAQVSGRFDSITRISMSCRRRESRA